MKKCIIFLLLSLTAFITAVEAEGQSVTLTVSAGRGREISLGDLFYIYVQVKDLDAEPQMPSTIPGAKLMYFTQTGQSSSYSNINGKMSQSLSITYTATFKATDEGKFSYGPLVVGGISSNKVTYAIGAPMPAQQPQNQYGSQSPQAQNNSGKPEYIGKGDGNLFMRAEVSNHSAYVNQGILYTVKLYSTYDAIKFIGATASPKFDGFVVEESKDISTSLTYENYNGKTYATAVIARYIIFPQHEGSLMVKGNTYTVSVDQREYYRDPFYGSLSYSTPLQLNVTPNELTINVKPLPKPVPADFSGGVGNFNITSSLPAQKFVSNQAASIIYTVTGSGNIKYITLPNLQNIFPDELDVYTPTTESDINVGRADVSGKIMYDYSFMPLEGGVFKLPDVKLVYFNPATGTYETSVARGYEISVEKGEGSEKSQTKSKLVFNGELMPVKEKLSFTHRPYVFDFLYWLFYIIPIGLLIISYSCYKAYLSSNSDIMAVKSRKAGRMARKRLKRAFAYMKAGQREDFYDEILISLWGYLSDKLHIPTSELSRENITGKLAMKDISDDQISKLISLIDDVEFEKYAPSSQASEMNDVYEKTISMMNSLEESFKKSSETTL